MRILLWVLVALSAIGFAALLLARRDAPGPIELSTQAPAPSAAAQFALTDGNGRSFSSSRLNGKPYAIFFGFTRCGDVCPTTLGRLVKLREQAGGTDAFNIVFVTIDPAHDGPAEVGQYATLFNSPIIGLTGSKAQIDTVKAQFGIVAEPNRHATSQGDMIAHTSRVLLFGSDGKPAGSIGASDPDAAALAQLKSLT